MTVGMNRYEIYYEAADTDDPRTLLGEVEAGTMTDALNKAAQYFEYPQHDLIAVQVGPALVRCPYCGNMHQSDQVENCLLKPRQ